MNQYRYDIPVAGTPSGILMTVASVIAALLSFYSLLIWIRIILTWIRIPGRSMQNNPLTSFLAKIVDPYLAWFRGITALRRSHFDLTPLVALAVLSVIQSIFRIYGTYGTLTVALVFALILQTIWSYLVSPILWFIIILLGIRLFFCYRKGPNSIVYINMLDSMVGPILSWIQRIFFGNRPTNDRKLVTGGIVFFILLDIVCSQLLRFVLSVIA